MTTGSAEGVSHSGATLNGSYAGASSQPYSLGFEYGTETGNLSQTAYWNDTISESEGSYSVTLGSLDAGTTYYYRAVVQVGSTDFRGEVLSFTTSDAPKATPGSHAWLELPAVSGGEDFVGTFYSTGTSGTAANRNYTYNYDYSNYAALWVAYPLCSSHTTKSATSSGDWNYNSQISTSYQVNIVSSSYPTMYGADDYARGHQIPNADRVSNAKMNSQTYLATNQTPQLQDKFNGSVWSSLEGTVRTVASATDTLYVVTGAAFRKVGGSETITYLTGAKSEANPASLPVPNYYWKVLLKVKRSGTTVTSASAIGVWMPHKEYSDKDWSGYVTTVDQIEQWTGFDFFVNLPDAIETSAEALSNWNSFSSF